MEADYQLLITSYSLLIRAGTLVYRQGVRSVICVEGKSLACPALGGLAHGG